MSIKTYSKQVDKELNFNSVTELPTNKPIAIYYRQSTDAQVGNVSTSIQTVDMVKHLKNCGWEDENIIMIDMDAGVSGTTKIDERQGMKILFDMITSGEIGVVACQDEDRLFRDVTQIQVNIFIDACKNAGVLVLTPSVVYDFAHPQMGTIYIRQFRTKSEMSAEYITSYVKGRLHKAKRRVMMQGQWAGGSVPLGFMVDERKKLASGIANPNYRRYTIYEPFAEIIREYFRLFVARNGNLKGTARYIIKKGSYFPDVANTKAPEGFRFVGGYTMKDYGNGFCPASGGLAGILTNVAYLGHWTVNGIIRIWDNHDPIVPTELFMQAFNYLSPTTFTGEPNPHHRNFRENARPSLEEDRPVEKPLLSGMIFTQHEDRLLKGRTSYVGKEEHYAYNAWTPHPIEQVLWWKKAVYVDAPVVELLKEKVKITFDDETWQKSVAEFEIEHGQELEKRQRQLDGVERTMNNLLASLDTLDNPTLIAKVQDRFNEAESEYNRLKSVLAETNQEIIHIETVRQLREDYATAFDSWDEMTRDEKRTVLHAFINRIVISRLDNQGLQVAVEWRDSTTDELRVGRNGIGFSEWRITETRDLKKLVKDGATQLEIGFRFPNRTWKQIYMKVYGETGEGYTPSQTPMRKDETYTDYLKRSEKTNIPYKATAGKRWSEEDATKLVKLIDENSTQLKIAETFPHRKWYSIRQKIRKVLGNGVEIPDSGHVRKMETYYEYKMRLERDTGEIDEEQGVSVYETSENEVVQKKQSKMRQAYRTRTRNCAATH